MYPWSSSSSYSRAASAAAAETAVNVAEGGSQEEAGARMTFAAAGQGPSSLSHRHPQQQQSPPSSAWQLVEQRQQRSTWGRPIQPLGPGGGGEEPSRMHQLISKIGNGASAGIVRPLPCMAPSSATSLTETPAAAAAVVVDATTSTFMAEDRAGITADSASSLASSLSPEWRVVELRCKSHAHEVALLDRRGRSCLHAACAKKAPVSTVEAILKANATGTSKSSAVSSAILLQRDKHGRTPLLIAIASHADLPVIAFLLQKSHEAGAVSDHLGNSPLMLACEACNNKNPVDDHQVELVRLLLQAFPEAAQRESLNGRMALHVAVECNAPTAVVAQLVQAYPQAAICDGCGLNPLFLAIRYNVRVETIQTMVAACPQATWTRDRGHGLPLRRAMENQSPLAVHASLCTSPMVVLDAEASSPHVHNTALHAALESSPTTVKVATVELMLRMAPQLALAVSKSGQTPLTLACQQWQRFRDSLRCRQLQYQIQQQSLLAATANTTTNNNNIANTPTLAAIHTLEAHCRHMWLIIIPLIKAAFYGVIDDPIVINIPTLTMMTVASGSLGQQQQEGNHDDHDNHGHDLLTLEPSSLHRQPLHVLHAAVFMQPLPLDVVTHALEMHSQDAAARNDPSGRYPLQLAILRRQAPQQQTSQEEVPCGHPGMAAAAAIQRFNKEKNLLLLKEQVILKTLQVYPQATQLPDVTGRLALSLAAQQATSISTNVLEELWLHHPAALATLDPFWRLYPFQIAAVQKEQPQPCQQGGGRMTTSTISSASYQRAGEECWKEMQDLRQLSAIFVLLTQRPDLIHLHLCKS